VKPIPGFVHEAHHVNRVLRFELEFIKLLWVEQDVMPLGVFVALDDFLVGHLDKLISVSDAFHITDWLAARLMDHAECDCLLRRALERYGNEDEGQAKIADQSEGGGITRTQTL